VTGESLALLAAVAYGLAGVTIVKGKATARGDNGVFLSVVATAVLTGALWLGWGTVSAADLRSGDSLAPVTIFILAGLFSTVLGRMTMYRATERIGPVAASLLRRLTPVFALPIAFVLLSEIPDAATVAGGVLVVLAALFYLWSPGGDPGAARGAGLLLGVGSAGFYAAAYALRSLGLDTLPDAALGTFIGALAGCLWFLVAAGLFRDRAARLRRLVLDRGRWHWLTALALSAGQTLQFFALKSASVVAVATLGTLEVFFSALLIAVVAGARPILPVRLLAAGGLAAAGTALLVW